MSPHQIVAVAVRLFALWAIVYLVRAVPGYFVHLKRFDDPVTQAVILAGGIALVVLVLVLWFFSRTAAKILLPGDATPPTSPASAEVWFAIGCSLLGLWILTQAVPGLLRYFIVLIWSQRSGIAMGNEWHEDAIYDVLQSLIGFWLLLGTKGLRRLVLWARVAGAR